MRTLFQDVRYALRQLRNAPGFTITAILTLALGIGANSAVFSLVNEVLLKSLPVENPHGLYRIGDKYECCVEGSFQDDWTMFPYPFYQQVKQNTPEFLDIAASQTNRPDLSVRREGSGTAESFTGELVSGNFFSVLGLKPFAGRLINTRDDQKGAPYVAVMSYRAWQLKYGMDGSIVGSNMMINGIPVTLIGIAPPGFYGDRKESDPPDFWMPIAMEPTLANERSFLEERAVSWLYLIGRLRAGAQPAQVSAHLTTELQQYLSRRENVSPEQDMKDLPKQHIVVTPGASGVNAMAERYKEGLLLLLAASALILLIACANIANLLLVRGAAARYRTSLQLAIGASRARIMRARLTESIVLALLGGVAGLLLSFYANRGIILLAFHGADYVPISSAPSYPVLGFTFAVALLTGVIFGVAPAWIASKSDPADALRGAARSTQDRSAFGQKLLVVVQAALSLVLLTLAGLVTQNLRNLTNQPLGFDRDGRILIQISPQSAGYNPARLPGLNQQLEESFSHMPGVISASLSLYTAQQGNNWGESIHIAGRPQLELSPEISPSWDRVSAHYFETIGQKIVRGRGFKDSDTATSQKVAVVNERFVKALLPDVDPIGQHFGKGDVKHAGDYEIVGVVQDAKYLGLSQKPRPMFFVPLPQVVSYENNMDKQVEAASQYMGTIELHVAGDPYSYQSQIRQTLANVDPNLAPLSIRSFGEQLQIRTSQDVLISRLSGIFGLIALLLASIGLYGVTAYQVARRTGEIGLRMALGADRVSILKLVLRGAFSQVGLGLAIGLPLVFIGGRLLASELFGVRSFEPVILSSAVIVLGVAAFLASMVPARRAASIEPMKALRTE